MTPLHVAVERGDRINIMKYLLNKGADIDSTDNYGVNKFLTVLSTPNSLLVIVVSLPGKEGIHTLCQHNFEHN